MTSDLNDLVADPSKISDENNALATKDLFGLLKAEFKGFLSFAGGASHFVSLADQVGDLMGKGGLVDMLGLDKTLPEIWGKESFGKAKEVRVSGISASNLSEIRTALDATDEYRLNSTLGDMAGGAEAERQAMGGITQRLDDAVQASGAKLSSGTANKIAASVVKVLGPATDLAGGFADIVLGAFTIKDGVKSGDKLAQAAGGLQIAGGAFGASAGVLGTAALVGAGGAAATALAGPFFLVGVVIAVVGGIIGYFVDHNKKQKASEKENDWYRDLAADGLLQSDWGDKVEYAHYSIHHYREREAPEDDNLFRFQSAEWKHFDETPQEGGSSTNRLDDTLHVEYGEPHKSPDQQKRDELREAPRWSGSKV